MTKDKGLTLEDFKPGDTVRIKGLPGTVAEVVGTKANRLRIQYTTERGLMEAQVRPFILKHVSVKRVAKKTALAAGIEVKSAEDLELLPASSVVAGKNPDQVYMLSIVQVNGIPDRRYWYSPGSKDGLIGSWLQSPGTVLRYGTGIK